jgi:RHS repeat-associated protein
MKRIQLVAFLFLAAALHGAAEPLTEPGWFQARHRTRLLSLPDPEGHPGARSQAVLTERAEGEALDSQPTASIAEAITPEIQALAHGLGNDPVRIYNYVHDHIRFVLYFGSKKGAQLTLLERSGNDFDQSALLVALLRAAGYTNAAYQFGWMRLPYENPDQSRRDLRHWLRLSLVNSNWAYTSNYLVDLFLNGRSFPSMAGYWGTNTWAFQRVWVKLPIGPTSYYLDPAFKVSEPISGAGLSNAMGLSRTALLNAAGGTVTSDYVQNLSEEALRDRLRDHTTNLLAYLRSNQPNASVEDVLSGWRIVPSTNTALSPSLLFPTEEWNGTLPILDWVHQPTNLMATMTLRFAGTNYQWFMPALGGQRLTLTFSSGGLAQLWQEDTLLAQQTAGGSSRTTNVVLSINHVAGYWDYYHNVYVDETESEVVVTNAYQRTNATYNLLYAFEPHWGWLQARQQRLEAYRAAGLPDTSREVVSETLNIMGLNWQLQHTSVRQALGAQMDMSVQSLHRLGRMAQELGRGYYVDAYTVLSGDFSSAGNDAANEDRMRRYDFLNACFGSSLEHGVIEQLQAGSLVGASTVKMLHLANAAGQKIFLGRLANWTTGTNVRSQLVNYTNLATLDAYVANGYSLLLPQNGSNAVAGPGSWTGQAYVARGAAAIAMRIGGDYFGGYVSLPTAQINPTIVGLFGSSQPHYFNPVSPLVPAATGADPVSMADGAFHLSTTDLALGGTEPRGLTFTRHYSTARRDHHLAGLAHGWVHNYFVQATEVAAPQAALGETTPAQMAPLLAAVTAAIGVYRETPLSPRTWTVTALVAQWAADQLTKNGVSIALGADTLQFTRQPDGSFTPPAGSTMSLEQVNAAYQLRERHGRTFRFDSAGRLTNIVDQYNQPLSLTYNASNWVATVKDWKNRTLTLSYSGSPWRLTSVNDGVGRSVSYGYSTAYNARGDLVSVTDPENQTSTFVYDTNHQILASRNALGQTVTSNAYDGFGRVVAQSSQGDTNQTWRFFWSGYENTEQDPAGGQRTFYYDDQHRLTSVRDALGNLSRTFYDGQDHVVMTVSPLAATNRFEFDGRHNLLRVVDPLGFTNGHFYDAQDRLVRSVDARGQTNRFGYNAQHSLTGSTNGAGDWTTFTYNTDGTLHSRADPGGATTYSYDTWGQQSRVTHPADLGVEGYVDNSLGDVLSHTNARGFVTSFQYDARRELTNTIAPSNLTERVVYDAAGNVAATTDARGFVTSNTWSATRKRLATTLPATPHGAPVITYAYDTRDWLARTVDPLQAATSLTNDPAGRRIAQTDPLLRTTRFAYDADGRRIATTNAALEVIRQEWTARGELARAIDGAGRTVGRAYDAAGNQVLLTNRNGKLWQFQYDGAHRLTNTVSPLGRSTVQTWNDRGLLASVKEPSGQTATLTYDAKGRLTNRTDSVGAITYRHDANNNLTNLFVVPPSGGSLTNAWTYDAYDRVSNYRDADGNLIQYRYDANGSLTNLVYPGGRNVFYAYDSLNRLTNVTDWANRRTSLEYDLASRLRKITRPNGTVRELSYDAAGQTTNILERTATGTPIAFFKLGWNAAARMAWEFAAPFPHLHTPPTRTMTYDEDNRLATFNGHAVTHDLDGNLTHGLGTNDTFLTYTYDARNRLVGTLSTASLTYGYDPAGHRTSLTNGTTVTRFVVNPNATLSQVLLRTQGGGTNYYVYGLGLLYEVDDAGNTTTYHYDYRGSTVALTDGSGKVTDRMEYSAYGTLTYRAGTKDTPFLYNGRYGVQTDPNGLLYMRARYYNPYLCRFLNPDPAGFSGGLNFYAYADGNPISLLDPFGLCALGESGGGYWLGVGQVWQGYGQAAWGFLSGLGSAILHPVDTTLGLAQAVVHPVSTAGAIWGGVSQTFSDLGSTDPRVSGQAMGNILLTAASVAAPYARTGQAAGVANAARGGTTPLYRAVAPGELADLSANAGAYRNPLGIEVKYFSETAEGAASYARQAYQAGGSLYQGPYTIVRTDIASDLITPIMRATPDRGIPTVTVPTELLPRLTPAQPLPATPLPRRP